MNDKQLDALHKLINAEIRTIKTLKKQSAHDTITCYECNAQVRTLQAVKRMIRTITQPKALPHGKRKCDVCDGDGEFVTVAECRWCDGKGYADD